MKVLQVSAEIFPLLKTGGLADIAGALPAALNAAGCEVRVLLPAFASIVAGVRIEGDAMALPATGGPEVARALHPAPRILSGRVRATGQAVYLLDAPSLYLRPGGPYLDANGHDWPDNAERFALLGWAAVRGEVDAGALLLFLIIFTWTPPHFWALAIHRRDEYAKVDVPMLPVTHGVPFTHLQVVFYTILLVLVTLLPYFSGMSGVFYLGGVLVLDAVFLYYAIRMMKPPNEAYAMKVFGYSIWYLMVLFAFLLIDHWIMPAK